MIILFLLFYLSHPGNSFQAASPEKKRQRAADAVRNEAMKYEMGRGGYAVDEKEAARLYRRAALKFEDATSARKLGFMYFEGRGVFRNSSMAVEFWRRAAVRGNDSEAMYLSAVMAHKGFGRRRDDAAAASMLKRAAAASHPKAQYFLGVFHELGVGGLGRSDVGAVRWFRASAELGYAPAQYKYAVMLRQGRGVAADDGAAGRWFGKAAAQGHSQAQQKLDVLEWNGQNSAPAQPPSSPSKISQPPRLPETPTANLPRAAHGGALDLLPDIAPQRRTGLPFIQRHSHRSGVAKTTAGLHLLKDIGAGVNKQDKRHGDRTRTERWHIANYK